MIKAFQALFDFEVVAHGMCPWMDILLMYNEIARSDGSLFSKPTEAGWVSGGGKALDRGGLDLEPR